MSRGGPRPAAQSRGCNLKTLLTVVLTVCLGVGCQRQQVTPEPFALVIGSFGHTSGRFNRPRGLAFNAAGDALAALGVSVNRIPLKPEIIRRLIDQGRAKP